MKKLTLWMVACLTTLAGFAAGGNITYELNGGVTNDKGWKDKEDMYQGLYQAWNTFNKKGDSNKEDQTAWTPLAQLLEENGTAEAAVPKGIPTQAATMDVTFIQDETVKAEWQWLVDYMDAVGTEQKVATLPSTNGAFLRYTLSAFFFNSVRSSWPATADYSIAGQPEAFMPTWKHGFAGPATYDGTVEIVLPAPYREGYTFVGWYDNAEFTGEKVASIPAGAEGDKNLYAKWVEYIPSCKEVAGMEVGTETKVSATVSMVLDKQVWMQDATAGLMAQFAETPDLKAGDAVTLSGKVAALGDYKILTEATVVDKSAGEMPTVQTVTLATLVAGVADYMFEYVKLEGLKATKNDGKVITVTDDGTNEINISVATEAGKFEGELINVLAVVSNDAEAGAILVANASDVTKAPLAGVDPFDYPARYDGAYTLTNRWLISNNMDNLSANPIGLKDYVRGMLATGGKMYFIDREKKQLTVVDGQTGEKLDPIVLADDIFTYQEKNEETGEMETKTAGTLPFNDIKMDNAGNILLGNCITSSAGRFQIWKVDLATGKGTLIIDDATLGAADRFPAQDEEGLVTEYSAMRFDAFGVYGDVDNDGYILAADASEIEGTSTLRVFKWTIEGGEVTYPTQGRNKGEIKVDNVSESSSLNGIMSAGTAPQVFPISEDMFYLDGFNTVPALINMQGRVVDGFPIGDEAFRTDSVTVPGERYVLKEQLNGITEFQVGDDYFALMACGSTDGNPPSSFRLYKYANDERRFSEMECFWTFPQAGMGSASNVYRTAVPYVEVDDETATATIYLYAGENGYGVYEFKGQKSSAVNGLNADAAVSVLADGHTLRMSEEVAQVSVYSLNGQLSATAVNVSAIDVANDGLYVVKMITLAGEPVVQKVLVK